MKSVFPLAAALALAAPALAQAQPRDAGSMAYPALLPQGSLSTTRVGPQPRDTGILADPAPARQRNDPMATGPQPRDTGILAYPAPLPQGNPGATTVR